MRPAALRSRRCRKTSTRLPSITACAPRSKRQRPAWPFLDGPHGTAHRRDPASRRRRCDDPAAAREGACQRAGRCSARGAHACGLARQSRLGRGGLRLSAAIALADSGDPFGAGAARAATRCQRRARCRGAGGGRRRDQVDRTAPGGGGRDRDGVYRSLAGLDPAARSAGSRHHLWRDGRDQHGPWRAADGWRLCHLCDPGAVPEISAGHGGWLPAGRDPGVLPGRGAGRGAHGAHRDPLSTAARWRACSPPGAFRWC